MDEAAADTSRLSAVLDLAALAQQPLHPDLTPYLDDGFLGMPSLKHPLVFQVPLVAAGLANLAYEQKTAALAAARTERTWHQIIWLHERPYRLEALLSISQDPDLPDAQWWDLVGDVWTDSENIWQNLDAWEEVWSDPRPGRHEHVMNDGERSELASFSEPLAVFRGCVADVNEEGMSWTVDRSLAEWFARRFDRDGEAMVVEAQIAKADVYAYLHRRNEREIVLPLDAPSFRHVSYHEV